MKILSQKLLTINKNGVSWELWQRATTRASGTTGAGEITMIRIRCMSRPRIGDRFRLDPDCHLITDATGCPVSPSDDDSPDIASWPIGRVESVGAYWSRQDTGTSGWYVDVRRET